MSEKNAKAARKAARLSGEYTGKPAIIKGEQMWPQWPTRAVIRTIHKKQVAETRRRLHENARKLNLAKRYGNKGYRITANATA